MDTITKPPKSACGASINHTILYRSIARIIAEDVREQQRELDEDLGRCIDDSRCLETIEDVKGPVIFYEKTIFVTVGVGDRELQTKCATSSLCGRRNATSLRGLDVVPRNADTTERRGPGEGVRRVGSQAFHVLHRVAKLPLVVKR